MSSNVLADDVEALLTSMLDDLDGVLYVTDPDRATLEALVTALSVTDDVSVRLLADDRLLKDVFDDFIVASTAADLVAADRLALRVSDEPTNTLLVAPDRVVAIVTAGSRVGGLVTDDEAFTASAAEQYDERWDAATPYTLRTPPLSRVRETMSTDIGPEVQADFEAILGSLETARGNGDGLDEVTVSLLVAAKNEQLLYDISKWGEDVGIASKATFSRTKTQLEELGLIDTQKVPIDVGRPRLRLVLGDERLKGVSSDDLASVAQSLLAS